MKTVIFLGAGASKADEAPLQAELFSSYFQARQDPHYSTKYSYANGLNVEEIVRNFFNIFFNGLKEPYPTFEEALGILEPVNKKIFEESPYAMDMYKYSLIIAMEEAIKYKLDYNGRSSLNEYHLKLVCELHLKKLQGKVTFISSNYDLLIDNALCYLSGLDYGFGEKLKPRLWKLLKLHGSLNWLYCPRCKKVNSYIGQKKSLDECFGPAELECECGGKKKQ